MLRPIGLALVLVSSLGWVGGCLPTRPAPMPSLAGSRNGQHSEPDPNTVVLDLAFLERPIGDDYLNGELWTATDQHIVDIERQAELEDNGLRIGQVVGVMPGKLLKLLQSERACVNPLKRFVPCGEPTIQHLGPIQPRSRFQITLAGKTQILTLDDAQFCFDLVATLSRNGRTKLAFVPKVEHRRQALAIDIAPDYSSWVAPSEKPGRSFPQLSWHVELAPGELLVIGPMLDKPGSFGYRAFVQDAEPNPVQRVLVLRCTRPAADE